MKLERILASLAILASGTSLAACDAKSDAEAIAPPKKTEGEADASAKSDATKAAAGEMSCAEGQCAPGACGADKKPDPEAPGTGGALAAPGVDQVEQADAPPKTPES
jgi:hypothetical protein